MFDRDMCVRDFLALIYHTMLIVHNILWHQKITRGWNSFAADKCYMDKTWWLKDGSWPAAFLWNGVILLLYLWHVFRRRPTTIRLLSKATANRWAMRYMRFLSNSLPRSKWVS